MNRDKLKEHLTKHATTKSNFVLITNCAGERCLTKFWSRTRPTYEEALEDSVEDMMRLKWRVVEDKLLCCNCGERAFHVKHPRIMRNEF